MSRLRRYLPMLVDSDEGVYIAVDVDAEIARLKAENERFRDKARAVLDAEYYEVVEAREALRSEVEG